MLQNRRHYKKDSRFVLDLYTLTFDEDESVEDTHGVEQSAAVERRGTHHCIHTGYVTEGVGEV